MIDLKARVFNLTVLPEPIQAAQWGETLPNNDRVLTNKGQAYLWSGVFPIPAIGTRVVITMNDIGAGVVESYFTEYGFLGIKVTLENEPTWHAEQNAGTQYAGVAHVFGAELEGGRGTPQP